MIKEDMGINVKQGTIMSRKEKRKLDKITGNFSKALKNEDGNKVSNVSPGSQVSSSLHLCTSKTPTKSADLSDKGNSYHALEKCKGVNTSIASTAMNFEPKYYPKNKGNRKPLLPNAAPGGKYVSPISKFQELKEVTTPRASISSVGLSSSSAKASLNEPSSITSEVVMGDVTPRVSVSSSKSSVVLSSSEMAALREDVSSMKLPGVSSSSSAAAGVSSKIKLKDIIRRQMNTIRAISAFKGINPTKIYQHLQRIISKIPDIKQRLDVEDVASLLTEQGEKEAAAFAAWDEMFSDPEAQIELLNYKTMTDPININGKYIKPVIAEGWEQGDVVKNADGIWEPEFYRIDETGERIKWDKKAGLGDIPYFNISDFLARKVFDEPIKVSVAFLAHGQYYGLKYPLFCLNRGCLAGGPMVEYNPVAAIGNANFSGPIKDNLFFNGLSEGRETLVELAKQIFQTIRHYYQYKKDPDVQINTERIQQQTVTSNRYLPNKLLSFTEDITPGPRVIINEHATRFNHGVYIGKNNLGLPEGTKIDISELIKDSDGDVTLEVLVKYLIARFNLKEGDKLEINDTSCAVLMYDAGGKNARTNRRGARSLQNIIAEIIAGKEPMEIYKGIAADKKSNFEEYLKGEPGKENNRRLQSYYEEIMKEFSDYLSLPANEAVAGIGGYKKRQTRKLKSGLLTKSRRRKPNRRLKRNTRKMHNKSRKRRTRRSKR
jgi:hypothetical protein